jgi:hypothetical protein
VPIDFYPTLTGVNATYVLPMMPTSGQLLQLAEAYAKATGLSLTQVGVKSCNNDKIFPRLAKGRGCNVLSVERAAAWFYDNWPPGTPWPIGVPRRLVAV